MFRYHAKSLFQDFLLAVRGKEHWFEVRYHALSLWSEITYPFRAVWYGLENLWAYLPIIWHDRDWDYSCLLTLWAKKFDRMADLFQNYGHHVGDEERARQLRVCASLCRRIREDDYNEPMKAEHEAQWGRLDWFSSPTENPRLSRMNFFFPGVKNEQEEKLADWHWHRIHNHAEKQKKADLEYLAQIIGKNLLGWWD
jgi:hypothetical protein